MQATINNTNIPNIVIEISDRLIKNGYRAFIVGGAVRDSLLGLNVKDWDVATNASPDRIKKLFHYMTSFNLKHGTVTLVSKGSHFEVTTFRGKENFVMNIEEDLSHRDFTLNAMAYDIADNIIIDPFYGQKDIRKKAIRAVRNALDRFQEDPLRMMRAVRFSLELGYTIDADTLNGVSSMKDAIDKVSIERIRDEFLKILTAEKPSVGFNLLRKTGLLTRIMPELLEGYGKRQNNYHKYTIYRHIIETVDFIERDPILRLSALFHDIAKPRVREKRDGRWRFFNHPSSSAELARDIMMRMRFSNEWINIVTGLVSNHMFDYKKDLSDRAIRRFVKRVGINNIDRLISLRRADDLAHGWEKIPGEGLNVFKERIDALRKKSPPLNISDLKINGNDVMDELNLNPGPEISRILNKLLEAVIEEPELNEKDKLIKKLNTI
ncbi:MAG: CCA tRNA nucleotidyltransferase [Thermodesulfobacteriota bacterium]|nr:CCA tRNA nucleotidyltransferase [Thermodesulfobacteriota bacterium]